MKIVHPDVNDKQPPCHNDDEWEHYIEDEAASVDDTTTPPSHSGYCQFCTPEYQAEMIAQRKCVHPNVTFRLDEEGGVEGVRPKRK